MGEKNRLGVLRHTNFRNFFFGETVNTAGSSMSGGGPGLRRAAHLRLGDGARLGRRVVDGPDGRVHAARRRQRRPAAPGARAARLQSHRRGCPGCGSRTGHHRPRPDLAAVRPAVRLRQRRRGELPGVPRHGAHPARTDGSQECVPVDRPGPKRAANHRAVGRGGARGGCQPGLGAARGCRDLLRRGRLPHPASPAPAYSRRREPLGGVRRGAGVGLRPIARLGAAGGHLQPGLQRGDQRGARGVGPCHLERNHHRQSGVGPGPGAEALGSSCSRSCCVA